MNPSSLSSSSDQQHHFPQDMNSPSAFSFLSFNNSTTADANAPPPTSLMNRDLFYALQQQQQQQQWNNNGNHTTMMNQQHGLLGLMNNSSTSTSGSNLNMNHGNTNVGSSSQMDMQQFYPLMMNNNNLYSSSPPITIDSNNYQNFELYEMVEESLDSLLEAGVSKREEILKCVQRIPQTYFQSSNNDELTISNITCNNKTITHLNDMSIISMQPHHQVSLKKSIAIRFDINKPTVNPEITDDFTILGKSTKMQESNTQSYNALTTTTTSSALNTENSTFTHSPQNTVTQNMNPYDNDNNGNILNNYSRVMMGNYNQPSSSSTTSPHYPTVHSIMCNTPPTPQTNQSCSSNLAHIIPPNSTTSTNNFNPILNMQSNQVMDTSVGNSMSQSSFLNMSCLQSSTCTHLDQAPPTIEIPPPRFATSTNNNTTTLSNSSSPQLSSNQQQQRGGKKKRTSAPSSSNTPSSFCTPVGSSSSHATMGINLAPTLTPSGTSTDSNPFPSSSFPYSYKPPGETPNVFEQTHIPSQPKRDKSSKKKKKKDDDSGQKKGRGRPKKAQEPYNFVLGDNNYEAFNKYGNQLEQANTVDYSSSSESETQRKKKKTKHKSNNQEY